MSWKTRKRGSPNQIGARFPVKSSDQKYHERSMLTYSSGRCPVCGEPVIDVRSSSSKGFKGAKYTTTTYLHKNKECTLQKAFYPDYFGKGPKTVVHQWSDIKKPDSPSIFIEKGKPVKLPWLGIDTFKSLMDTRKVRYDKESKMFIFDSSEPLSIISPQVNVEWKE